MTDLYSDKIAARVVQFYENFIGGLVQGSYPANLPLLSFLNILGNVAHMHDTQLRECGKQLFDLYGRSFTELSRLQSRVHGMQSIGQFMRSPAHGAH